jgi:hypothetical protein
MTRAPRKISRSSSTIDCRSESSDLLEGEIFAVVDYNYDDAPARDGPR